MAEASTRKQRLSRSADFERVYRHGRSAQHRFLVLYRFERPEDIRGTDVGGAARIGVTVSRKLGNAVERNRLKRQLREAIQACEQVPEGYDLVAIARPGLGDAVERNGVEWLGELVRELVGKLNGPTKA